MNQYEGYFSKGKMDSCPLPESHLAADNLWRGGGEEEEEEKTKSY
jgi:hypothetical protein